MFVTTQRKRCGSYSTRTKTVRLNAAVRRMPRRVLEAVVAHELVHAFHADHLPAFWDLLVRVCPESGRRPSWPGSAGSPTTGRGCAGGRAGDPWLNRLMHGSNKGVGRGSGRRNSNVEEWDFCDIRNQR